MHVSSKLFSDTQQSILDNIEESCPRCKCFHSEEEFYSGEEEILATRGEILLEELECANKNSGVKRQLVETKDDYSYPSNCWREAATKIYCGQGNPILFNAVSNILHKDESTCTSSRAGKGDFLRVDGNDLSANDDNRQVTSLLLHEKAVCPSLEAENQNSLQTKFQFSSPQGNSVISYTHKSHNIMLLLCRKYGKIILSQNACNVVQPQQRNQESCTEKNLH